MEIEDVTAKPATARLADLLDNCPNNANADQADIDDDGRSDVCDTGYAFTGFFQPVDMMPIVNVAKADTKYARTKIALVGKITGINTSGKFPIVWLLKAIPHACRSRVIFMMNCSA